MRGFRHFLVENQAQAEIQQVADQMKKVGSPQNVQAIIKQLGAKDINDLIQKLMQTPQVQQVIAKYKQMKQQQPPKTEGVSLDEGWLSDIGNFFGNIVKWAFSSVTSTISHVFGGVAGSSNPVTTAAALILTFGLAPALLAAGAPGAAAATVGYTATWWGLMWFGKNVIEPGLKLVDPGHPS